MRATVGTLGITALVMVGGAGCAGPGLSAGYDAPDPGARLHAVVGTASAREREDIPRLVSLLESDDPAVRMLSIRTLERMTGTTLEYDHWAPRVERDAAVARWRAFMAREGLARSAMPADTDPLFRPGLDERGPASDGRATP